MNRTLRLAICLLAVGCISCGRGAPQQVVQQKQQPDTQIPKPPEDPDAVNKTTNSVKIIDSSDPHELLKMAADLYEQMNDFEVELTIGWENETKGKVKLKDKIYDLRLLAQRPNQFAMRGTDFPNLVSTGSKRFLYSPELDKYSEIVAPDNWNDLVTDSELNETIGKTRPLLFEFLCDDAYERLTAGATKIEYDGVKRVGSLKCHHIKIYKPGREIEVLLSSRDKPLLIRVATHIEDEIETGKPAPRGRGNVRRAKGKTAKFKRTLHEVYEKWATDQQLVAFAFAYSPPQGSTKTSSLVWDFNQSSRADSGLLGRSAPQIPLPLLDGSRIDLEKLRNNKIVLLDLWTSTYAPCINQLQVVASIADDYSDEVMLYTVNHREKREVLLKFLSQHSLDLRVALDSRGWTAWAYQVRNVPAAVLIDKQGRIRSVHIGMTDSLEQRLRTEIDALLQEDKLDNDLLDRLTVEMPASELVAALDVPNPRVREKAAAKLGEKGAECVPALIESLKSKNADVRYWSAVALERIGPGAADAGPDLLDALLDRNPTVHDAATDALGHIGEPIVDLLFSALSRGTVSKRMGSARALGMVTSQADKITPRLIIALGDENSLVREAAADGLAALGVQCAPSLTEAIAKTTSERVAMGAGEALTEMGEAAIPQLLKNLEHSSERVRYVSVISLGNIGVDSDEVLAALRARVEQDNDNVRFYADQALKKLGQGS